MSRKQDRHCYPNGVLTKPFRPAFKPGSHELTAESLKQEAYVLRALAKEIGFDGPLDDAGFWEGMARALMRRHVPAFHHQQAGRPETRADVHGFWLRLWRQALREHPRTSVFKHIAKKLNKLPKPEGEYCVWYGPKIDHPLTADSVKGFVNRARAWERKAHEESQRRRAGLQSIGQERAHPRWTDEDWFEVVTPAAKSHAVKDHAPRRSSARPAKKRAPVR